MAEDKSTPPVPEASSVFQLVRLASLRARQLQCGARPRVEPNGDKMLRIALREVLAGMVSWSVADPPAPIVPEKVPVKI
jgi:DNA-directed RNA polymerase omega subunit